MNLSESGQAQKAAESVYTAGLDRYLFIIYQLTGVRAVFSSLVTTHKLYDHLSVSLCVDISLFLLGKYGKCVYMTFWRKQNSRYS